VNSPNPTAVSNRLSDLAPGIVAAVSFSLTDTFAKVALINGSDVLTLSTFRSVVVLFFMAVWFRITDKPPVPATPRQRWIALGVGLLFCGIVFGLYKAIQYLPVPIAILSYFVYPLATGLIGALLGIDNVTWRGIAAAAVAFFGLALTVGAEPGGIVLAGFALVTMAAVCRVGILLVSRAFLQGIDARLTTWYSFVATSVVFSASSLATWNWNAPQNATGWLAFAIVTVATFSAVWTLFVSISRIGPFRSALIMNLEPLLATIISVPLLGEVLTPVQMLGGLIMLGALVAFQLRR
jgi:drug/metabolite transporter (DMT)-like permease